MLYLEAELSGHPLPLGDDAGLSAQLLQVDVVLQDDAVRTLQPIGTATGEHLAVGPTLVKLPAICHRPIDAGHHEAFCNLLHRLASQ